MQSFDALAAIELIGREHITHGTFVPLQLERLLGVPGLEDYDVVWRTSLPRNANGKILKRELRQALVHLKL